RPYSLSPFRIARALPFERFWDFAVAHFIDCQVLRIALDCNITTRAVYTGHADQSRDVIDVIPFVEVALVVRRRVQADRQHKLTVFGGAIAMRENLLEDAALGIAKLRQHLLGPRRRILADLPERVAL